MCKFLTGSARIEQTEKRRIWKLLDNEIFKADDNTLYLVPRNMQTDNYTIPMFASWIAGSPVDFDTRASHLHDFFCYFHRAIVINLTEKELRNEGYLKYSNKNRMWICEDIPVKFLKIVKIGKVKANNLFYKCMKASRIPLINRIILRLGTVFNIRWYIDSLFDEVLEFNLEEIYNEIYWEEKINARQ